MASLNNSFQKAGVPSHQVRPSADYLRWQNSMRRHSTPVAFNQEHFEVIKRGVKNLTIFYGQSLYLRRFANPEIPLHQQQANTLGIIASQDDDEKEILAKYREDSNENTDFDEFESQMRNKKNLLHQEKRIQESKQSSGSLQLLSRSSVERALQGIEKTIARKQRNLVQTVNRHNTQGFRESSLIALSRRPQ